MPYKTIRNFNNLVLDDGIKGVLLDFDNTVYLYDPAHHAALGAVSEKMQEKIGVLDNFSALYEDAQKIVKKRIPTHAACHSRILYFQTMFEEMGKGSMIETSLELEDLYWSVFIENMQLVEGIENFLNSCKKKGVKIITVSDLTTSIQFRKIASLQVGNLINFMVTSEETGVEKPSDKIFTLALQKAGLEAHEVVMIGDNLKKDIEGAEDLGILSFHIVHDQSTQKTSL